MPFTCSICSLDIGVGEELLSDEKMNLAHKRCVERLAKDPSHPSINIPSVYLSPPPPPPPAPPSPSPLTQGNVVYTTLTGKCDRCGAPASALAPRSCGRCYLDLCAKCEAEGCCGSKPAHIGEKTYCSICMKPCISMCPFCKRYVHGTYGMYNQNCGGAHEQVCPPAAEARNPIKKPSPSSEAALFKELFTEPKNPTAVQEPSPGRKKVYRKNRSFNRILRKKKR